MVSETIAKQARTWQKRMTGTSVRPCVKDWRIVFSRDAEKLDTELKQRRERLIDANNICSIKKGLRKNFDTLLIHWENYKSS